MNHPVFVILRCVLSGTSPQVALLVPVALEVAVDGGGESEASDVELAVLVEEGLFNVFLNDVGSFLAILLRLVHH
jgi:hypothetical protein